MAQNRWETADAPDAADHIAQRVYTSRLLGANPALVLHGGGNTSVKLSGVDVFGDPQDLLLVKGSGWDLPTIEASGFTALKIEPVRRLATLERLPDVEMARQLALCKTDPAAPAPSVEAILHSLLPHRFVDHTHSDAIVTVTNTVHGEELAREVFGPTVVVLPYVMPGFDLARLVSTNLEALTPETTAVVLMNHGVLTFGDSAREAYDRMIEIVSVAEAALLSPKVVVGFSSALARGRERRDCLALLRADVSRAVGASMVLTVHDDETSLSFAQHPDVARLSQLGPATPDHVIRTKPVPMLGRDVDSFTGWYEKYFERGSARARAAVKMLDPAPRVILDPELGVVTTGRTARDASMAADIYRHTISIILDAEGLGGYRPVGEADLFDVEYWDLEQAKLALAGPPRALAGQVALVTGAASGIGRAIAEEFLAQGAAVVGLDLNPDVGDTFTGDAWCGVRCDVSDAEQIASALDLAADRFGGLDIVVLNAGIFPEPQSVSELDMNVWERVLRINTSSALQLLAEAHPLLRRCFAGGRVVVIGSKNVAAPGPGAAAYSASKAALVQIARVLALEWAADGIRVNIIHPDAVFDTALWGDGLLESRAGHYGMSVEQYKRRNLLSTEITSRDVAELALAMVGPAFANSTGAQVPIDGGNERVI